MFEGDLSYEKLECVNGSVGEDSDKGRTHLDLEGS